jgi:hypothetical protein
MSRVPVLAAVPVAFFPLGLAGCQAAIMVR